MTLKLFMVLYGIGAVCVTVHLGIMLWKYRNINGLAAGMCVMAWMFSVICICTLTFASSSWLETYARMSPYLMWGLRLGIFSSAFVSYFVMIYVIRRLERHDAT